MRNRRHPVPMLPTLLLAVLSSSTSVASGEPLDVKLSDAVDPFSVSISADGGRVVFRHIASEIELASAPIESSTATKLNPPETSDPDPVGIAPDSSRVVFSARTVESLSELFSVPLAGGAATKLNPPLAPGARIYPGPISPDGAHVLYVTGPAGGHFVADGLFVVPLQGGAPIQLEMPLPADDPLGLARALRITPDGRVALGTWFVTFDDDYGPEPAGLFSVPLAGGPAVVLDQDPWFERFFQISPDGRRVVYRRASGFCDGTVCGALYSAPLAGGPAVKLTPQLASGSVFPRFHVTPDSTRAVYLAQQDRRVYELYSVPLVGGPITRLSHPQGTYELFPWEMSPDDERVVFAQPIDSASEAVYSAPVSGGVPTLLSPGPANSSFTARVRAIQMSSDSRRVVFADDLDLDDDFDLYSVPIAGGTVTRLGGPLVRGHVVFENVDSHFKISPDGTRVVFRADPDADGVFELYGIPIVGGVTTKLNGPLGPGEEVSPISIQVSPDSRHVVYFVSQGSKPVRELHSSRLPPVIEIDVRPHREVNTLPARGRGADAVAILGSDEVDVADVQLESLAFGPSEAAPAKHAQFVDTNSDGFIDLVTRYRRQEPGLGPGDTGACLAGVHDGFAFRSCDEIVSVVR